MTQTAAQTGLPVFINPKLESLLTEVERVISEARQDAAGRNIPISIADGTDCPNCGESLGGRMVSAYALLRLRDAKAAYDKAKGIKPSGLHSNAIPEATLL